MKYGLVLNDLLMKKTKEVGLLVDIGCSLADDNDFINGKKLKFGSLLLPSASSNQNCSKAFSGWSFSLLPAIIEAFSPPIEVPCNYINFYILLARALKTPHPKAPKEPPP